MSGILEARPFYHWRLFKRGGAMAIGSLAAAAAAGLCLLGARAEGWRPAFGRPPTWAVCGFAVLVVLAGVLWWRFSLRQDELFRRVQNDSYGRGAVVTIALLSIWGLGSWASLMPSISPLAPLLIFAVAKAFYWHRAVRSCL